MRILLIGGTRYFGKRLVHRLLQSGHQVWILSRGQTPDDFGNRVERLLADRNDKDAVKKVLGDLSFDCVVDQVCMTAQQAKDAVDLFAGRISYYLMTSTLSVYDFGANLAEEKFISTDYQPLPATDPMSTYREGKRAAENVFATQEFFKVGFARFPIVLGEDDYTLRLANEIKRIRDGQAIYYPNLDARMCFITSEDAAMALEWMVREKKNGSYNFASKDSVKLEELVKLIEQVVGKQAHLATEPTEMNLSPFGIPHDWTMNVSKAEAEGFAAKPLSDWLSSLIESLASIRG